MKKLHSIQTAESVTEGHPDKIADQISDAILDAFLTQDPGSRVACETLVTTGQIIITGEVTTRGYVDIEQVARGVVREVGYTDPSFGFDADSCGVLLSIHQQSPDIAQGVDTGGAGDQGIMVGYATNETEEFMPLATVLAHGLTRKLAKVRKDETIPYLRPDGKAQVTVERDGQEYFVSTVIVSAQHHPDATQEELHFDLTKHVIRPVLGKYFNRSKTKLLINPTGRFVTGGPQGDTGLTGRKIIIDTYGPVVAHGGGAFSGKDATKVDRSGAYMARYLAKNIVAAGLAQRCEVQLAYAIGVADPVALVVDMKGTGIKGENELVEIIRRHVDLKPQSIIERFNLRRPMYRQTAAYGHFGRTDIEIPWEKLDLVEVLKKAA